MCEVLEAFRVSSLLLFWLRSPEMLWVVGWRFKGFMALSSCLPIRGLEFLRPYGCSVSGGGPRLALRVLRLFMPLRPSSKSTLSPNLNP